MNVEREAQLADLAERAKLYPERPTSIDVVGLLADPHNDLRSAGDHIAAAEVVADLIAAAKELEADCRVLGIQTKRLSVALSRASRSV